MKNYFSSENGHSREQLATRWADDVAETMNQTYKKQLEMSAELYNRMFGTSFSKDRTAADGNNFGMKLWENNINMAEKVMDIYSDWMKQMAGFTTNSFYNEKNWKALSERITENTIENCERQIDQLKEFNNYFIDTLESSSRGTNLEASNVIKNFRKSTEENLDLFLNTVKAVLKPGDKELLSEINEQVDSIAKLNFQVWTDLLTTVSRGAQKAAKETEDATESMNREAGKSTKNQSVKNENREPKSERDNGNVNREKMSMETHKK
jgi:hypothetical protein